MAAKKKKSTSRRIPKLPPSASHSVEGLEASVYGGPGSVGRTKYKRPLEENELTHVVLTSSAARGKHAFSANRSLIEAELEKRSEDSGVHVEGYECRGIHLHLFVRFKRRIQFQKFMRTLTGMLARKITGAVKGKPFGRKFWDHVAYTRTVDSRDKAVTAFEAEVRA